MKKNWFIIALFISNFGAGFEHTFLNTLIPLITYDLGGIEYYTWTSVSFVIGNLILLPIVGKLSDRYNKMYMFIFGNVVLVLGSILCMLSENMFQLIFFRFITGIGAGTITVSTLIMVGLVFPIKERVKWNAILGVIYNISVMSGPTISAFLANYFSWRAIFFSPILFFVISSFLIIFSSKALMKEMEEVPKRKESLNLVGNFLLIFIITLLSLLLSFGGTTIPFTSILFVVLLLIFVFFSFTFYFWEQRSKEKIFPFEKFKDSVFRNSIFISIGAAIGKLAVLTFAPMFVVITLGASTTYSGYVLIPMLVIAPVSAYISGKLLLTVPYRWIVFINSISISLGLYMFSLINENSPLWYPILSSFVIGIGAGVVSQILIIILQETYPKKEISVITTTFTFFRWFGNLIGISLGTFMLTFVSRKVFLGEGNSIDLDKTYKLAYEGGNNIETIQGWTIVFQNLFFVLAIIVLIISLFSFNFEKVILKEK